MFLNDIGKMVESEWLKSFELRPDMNLYMGEYQVMPNHFHGIVGIGENRYNTIHGMNRDRRDAMHGVSTPTHKPTHDPLPQCQPIRPTIQKFGIHYAGV